MKWLKKLRLINWHYFTDETMEFGKQTLITGQNGAGKSTIIDALQVLFVADQRLIRFNPAAHDEAKRSMIHYLRGKIGNDDRSFVRDGDFTTYITAEFRDDDKKETFVVGVVIDVFRDNSYDEEFFILADHRLDDLEFVKPSGVLRNREEFKRLYSGRHARVRSVFERNKNNYQKALLSRMGQMHERFFPIFTKALSFKPIQDIRHFVYEYILDRRELQLDVMKQNFEIHEKYKRELEELNARRERLVAIRDAFAQYAQLRETVREQDYVIRRLKYVYQTEIQEQQEHRLARIRADMEQAERETALAGRKQEEARSQAQEAYQRWQNHAAERRKKEIAEEQERLEREQQHLQKQLIAFVTQLRHEMRLLDDLLHWEGNEAFSMTGEKREQVRAAMELLAHVNGLAENGESLAGTDTGQLEEALKQSGSGLSSLYYNVLQALTRTEDQLQQVQANIDELELVIRDLENRKRTYPQSVQKLKQLLEERLHGRTRVWIFCEEMEVEDESWRDAVEGYLNTQRYDLLVEPHTFAEALTIYEKEKFKLQLEGVGLVDTEKESRYLGTAETNSLANVLSAENPVIRAHVEHLLGKVMKADNEQELRKYRTAVTRTCMVYHNLVARQIPKRNYEIPYIGSKAIIRQLEIKRAELAEAKRQREKLMLQSAELKQWASRLAEKQSQYERLAESLMIPAQLRALEQALFLLKEELSRLDLSEADRLKSEYEFWTSQEHQWREKYSEAISRKAGLEMERKHLTEELYFQRKRVQEALAAWQAWREENDAEAEQRALLRWEDAEKQEIPTARKIENWENNWKGNMTRSGQEFQSLQLLRQKYNIDYSFNARVDAEDNEAYDSLLHEIEHLNIPDYQQKVETALKESEEEFKSHFIFKLREAIEMARREFHELNYALRNFPFSQDKYQFEVTANEKYKRFYAAVMDPNLTERGSLFDIPDNDRSHVLHELFELLVRGEAGDLEQFTDYRHYLDFDIIVSTNDSRYRFSQVLKEKSGGETQTPFYIAILASFYHLYHTGKTMRLVVFDEAFNKMDEQRIQASLRLIKQLRLQLIASVPDEKMQHMAPEVSTTLIVSNINYRCFVDMVDRWEEDGETESLDKTADGQEEAERLQQEFLF